MNELPRSPKLKPLHLDRVALVYVRNSSPSKSSSIRSRRPVNMPSQTCAVCWLVAGPGFG